VTTPKSPKAPRNRARPKRAVTVCLKPEDVERIDVLRECLSTRSRDATRSDVLAEAIQRGLEDLERTAPPKRA
jgi:hypothetical protein